MEAQGTHIIGSGPVGPFDAFADSIDTVNRWLREGFLHKHTERQLPTHRDVCPCRNL